MMIVLIIAHAGIPMIGRMTKRATNTRNRARNMDKWYLRMGPEAVSSTTKLAHWAGRRCPALVDQSRDRASSTSRRKTGAPSRRATATAMTPTPRSTAATLLGPVHVLKVE